MFRVSICFLFFYGHSLQPLGHLSCKVSPPHVSVHSMLWYVNSHPVGLVLRWGGVAWVVLCCAVRCCVLLCCIVLRCAVLYETHRRGRITRPHLLLFPGAEGFPHEVGDEVYALWGNEGLFYPCKITAVDHDAQQCTVVFEDLPEGTDLEQVGSLP